MKFDETGALSIPPMQKNNSVVDNAEMYILRDVPSGNYRRNYKKEMYYEIPDVFLNIPDCDPEALLMLFTDSNAALIVTAKNAEVLIPSVNIA